MRGHMSTRLLNVVLFIFVLFSTALTSTANAGLIKDGIYTDSDGIEWIYFGSFDLALGPYWEDVDGNTAYGDLNYGDYGSIDPSEIIAPLNGLEAAALLFGLDINDLAISAYAKGQDEPDGNEPWVNHEAWYDDIDSGVATAAEDIDADVGDAGYSETGDSSAFIDDHADPVNDEGEYINHIFVAVEVPEPSTLAIFSLALFALGASRFKKQ